jgi:hypothetical protein
MHMSVSEMCWIAAALLCFVMANTFLTLWIVEKCSHVPHDISMLERPSVDTAGPGVAHRRAPFQLPTRVPDGFQRANPSPTARTRTNAPPKPVPLSSLDDDDPPHIDALERSHMAARPPPPPKPVISAADEPQNGLDFGGLAQMDARQLSAMLNDDPGLSYSANPPRSTFQIKPFPKKKRR